MVKSKKMSKSSIAVIVLALLLVLSMIMGITGAWFTAKYDFGDTESDTLGFGKVDINGGTGTTQFTYTIYDSSADQKMRLVDGDKITITDNLNVVNNSNVDILYYIEKTLDVEFTKSDNVEYALTKEQFLTWFKDVDKSTDEQRVALTEQKTGGIGSVAANAEFPELDSFSGTYVVDTNGGANHHRNEWHVTEFKITVTAKVYAVQKGNLLVPGENGGRPNDGATLANIKAAFIAAGVSKEVANAWTTSVLSALDTNNGDFVSTVPAPFVIGG